MWNKNKKLCFRERSSSCTSASSNYAPSEEHLSKRIFKVVSSTSFSPLRIYQYNSSRLPHNSHLRPHCSKIVETLQSHSLSTKSYNSPAKEFTDSLNFTGCTPFSIYSPLPLPQYQQPAQIVYVIFQSSFTERKAILQDPESPRQCVC